MRTQRSSTGGLLVVAVLLVTLLHPAPVPSAAATTPRHEASEQQFVDAINASRAARGRPAVAWSSQVAEVARAWSTRMASDGRLRHNPDAGEQLTMPWRRWGENVGWSSNSAGDALSSVVRRMHQAFMDSDGHRANILGDFNQVGVGVDIDRDGTMWATVVFIDGPIVYEPTPVDKTTPPAPDGDPGARDGGPTAAAPIDIAGSTHRDAILTASRRGLIGNCDGRRFCPSRQVSRRLVAEVVARMLDLEPTPGDHFDDVAARDVVNSLADAGVVHGCAPRRFCTDQPLTRAQLASLLVRALPDLTPSPAARFVDLPDGYVHAGAINALSDAGITRGCRADRFCPTARVSRGQLASFVVRALDL